MRGRAQGPAPSSYRCLSATVFRPCGRAISHNALMSVTRIAWLITVLVALLTGVLLLFGGYHGYAALGLAVAIAAAINLL
jgi:hypothetical protein